MWKYFTATNFIVICSVTLIVTEPIGRSLPKLRNQRSSSTPRETCLTPECVTAAASIIEAMDLTADPCENFFQFSCGGWIDKHPMPESKSRWTQFDILRDDVAARLKIILSEANLATDTSAVNSTRDMFAACMDTASLEAAGVKPLSDLLGLFGSWPMTISNWNENDFDWINAVTTARTLFGNSYLLEVYNYLDTNNTEQSSIYIDQTSLGITRSILVNINLNNLTTVAQAYKDLIVGMAKVIRDQLASSVTDSQIEQDVMELLAFEIELAKITTPQEDRRNNTRLYNPMPISSLQSWTDQVPVTNNHAKIQWVDYLNRIYQSAVGQLTDSERIIVVETEYMKSLVALLDRSSVRVIANYVHWRLVKSLAAETNQAMNDLIFQYNKVLLGINAPESRSLTCANKVNNYLGFSVGAKYVEEVFDEEAKVEAERMIGYLKTAFKSLVDEAVWMDDATKVIAKEKADAIRQFIAYPDWVKNNTALEEYYRGMQVSRANHFANIQNVNTFLADKDFKTLRGATDRTTWISSPAVVNAFYAPEYNSITFPAGILQVPFFGKGRLQAMNYGGIGGVIGHEITHGFDDQGRQSDKDGNTANWWSPETLTNYLQRAQCFIDQYSNYTIPELAGTDTPHLNGENTQGENIADNGGVREAYRAYLNYVSETAPEPFLPGLEQFTPEQIFFISYANVWCGVETLERLQDQIRTDPHSPSRFRVIGPLSNSDDFVREFNCPVGPMNRADKCILW